MTGRMLKQGGLHKAFKERFFILYPGFLVYYDAESTWKYDLQRGETLGGRLNAIKLKGGTVQKATQHPKGAKYAFVLHVPDPSNKRTNVMFNCKSNEERHQWIARIRTAIPNAVIPKAERKESESKQEETAPTTQKEEKKEPESTEDISITPPLTTNRQDTVDEAALLAGSTQHDDTAVTSIDSILGPRDGVDLQSTSSEGSYPNSLSPEPVSSNPVFPEPSKKENDSDTTVVTSISVEVNQHEKGLPSSPIPPETLEVPQQGEQKNGINRESTLKVTETSEVIVPAMGNPNFSLPIVTSGDSSEGDSSDSDDDDDENMLRGTPPPPKSGDLTTPKSSSPDSFVKNDSPPPPKSASPPAPAIEIENVENSNRQPNSNGIKEEHNNNILNSPTPDRRRPSGAVPFIEKRGYLYKMGGKRKTWYLRYFVLQPGMFSYYKSEPKGKPLGEVKLTRHTKINYPKPGEKTHSSYQFSIHSESAWNKRSDYVIAATNEKDMKQWIEAFKMASGILPTRPEPEERNAIVNGN